MKYFAIKNFNRLSENLEKNYKYGDALNLDLKKENDKKLSESGFVLNETDFKEYDKKRKDAKKKIDAKLDKSSPDIKNLEIK